MCWYEYSRLQFKAFQAAEQDLRRRVPIQPQAVDRVPLIAYFGSSTRQGAPASAKILPERYSGRDGELKGHTRTF